MTEQDIRNIIESYGYTTDSGMTYDEVWDMVAAYGRVKSGGDPAHSHVFTMSY